MHDGRFVIRILQLGALGTLLLASAAPARAEPERAADERACTAALRSAQQREQAGRLREAKEALAACAKPACGLLIQEDCASRYAQLGKDIPSIVPVVTDDSGAPRTDIQVRVDGELVATEINGRALSLNPGMHELSFSADDRVFDTQRLLILQGQRNRLVSASLPGQKRARRRTAQGGPRDSELAAPEARDADGSKSARHPLLRMEAGSDPASTSADATPGRRTGLALALGAVGLASAGAGGLLVYWGRADNQLLAQCSPGCPKASVDHIHRLYLGGDIALGAGALALVGAFWAYALPGSAKEDAPPRRAYSFNVQPTSSGALVMVSGAIR
jgi:hypothetical protein